MRWNYSMPETLGNNRAMQWFTDHGFNVMGATAGQTRWNLMPLEESNTANIRDFALISIANKADGLLLTLWDDDSPHFELYQRGIAIFAEYTWSGRSDLQMNCMQPIVIGLLVQSWHLRTFHSSMIWSLR